MDLLFLGFPTIYLTTELSAPLDFPLDMCTPIKKNPNQHLLHFSFIGKWVSTHLLVELVLECQTARFTLVLKALSFVVERQESVSLEPANVHVMASWIITLSSLAVCYCEEDLMETLCH